MPTNWQEKSRRISSRGRNANVAVDLLVMRFHTRSCIGGQYEKHVKIGLQLNRIELLEKGQVFLIPSLYLIQFALCVPGASGTAYH